MINLIELIDAYKIHVKPEFEYVPEDAVFTNWSAIAKEGPKAGEWFYSEDLIEVIGCAEGVL